MGIFSAAFAIFSFMAQFANSVPILNANAPKFEYVQDFVPSWPMTTFRLTHYNNTVASTNSRLHIEFFYDDPSSLALIYDGQHYFQDSKMTPDPYGILTDLYDQTLNINQPGRFVFPSIKMTISLNISTLSNAKMFVQGFKPDGVANGIPVLYVVRPALVQINGLVALQMTFPLTPFDVTWCDEDQYYQCPPGSPWNAGIPYFYPKAANLDMDSVLAGALQNVASYGSIYNVAFSVYTKSGIRNFNIPHVPFSVQYKVNQQKPMFQLNGTITPQGGVLFPPLLNGL